MQDGPVDDQAALPLVNQSALPLVTQSALPLVNQSGQAAHANVSNGDFDVMVPHSFHTLTLKTLYSSTPYCQKPPWHANGRSHTIRCGCPSSVFHPPNSPISTRNGYVATKWKT